MRGLSEVVYFGFVPGMDFFLESGDGFLLVSSLPLTRNLIGRNRMSEKDEDETVGGLHDDSGIVEAELGTGPIIRELQAVPPGTYFCEIEDIRPSWTRAGDKRWGMKFVVAQGMEKGRLAAWDGLVFSQRAMDRTRMVLSALGLPCSGHVQLRAEDLLGKKAWVTVETEDWPDPRTGQIMRRNTVPYAGIQSPKEKEAPEVEEKGDLF